MPKTCNVFAQKYIYKCTGAVFGFEITAIDISGTCPGNVGDSPGSLGDSPGYLRDSLGSLGDSLGSLGDSLGNVGDSLGNVGDSPNGSGQLLFVTGQFPTGSGQITFGSGGSKALVGQFAAIKEASFSSTMRILSKEDNIMASKDWYEHAFEALAAWWVNFLLRRPDFEDKYTILHTKATELDAIAAWVAYWVDARHAFDESSKQLTAYFSTIAGNDPNADPPSPFTIALPPGTPAEVPPGIEKFIRDVRREVVGLTNYAKADGEALGFEATALQPIAPGDVKPTISVFGATHDYGITIVVSNRAGVNNWDVYMTRKGGNRTKIDTCEGKSADITITPTTPGDAEQVQIDVQLRKNNANFGQPSDPAFVTANP